MSAPAWSDATVARLLDRAACPVCGYPLGAVRCARCGADYSGGIGAELWTASQAAAAALQARQAVLERVPRMPAPVAAPAPAPTPPPVPRPQGARGPSATVQSVLAVAGAGLFAVAAIVFTFFNPDLTDRAVRDVIVGAVTAVFLAGAWFLARRGLRFSAEAVGALGMVFLGLDVYAVSQLAAAGSSPWVPAAIATLVAGGATMVAAAVARLRVWLWVALLALALVPGMLGLAAGTRIAAIVGALGVGGAALALFGAVTALAARFDDRVHAERILLTTLELTAVVVVLASSPRIDLGSAPATWAAIAALLGGVAALAFGSARRMLARVWSTLAGAASAATLVCAAFAAQPGGAIAAWTLLVAPAAALVALLVVAVAPLPHGVARRFVDAGALGVAGLTTLPPLLTSLGTGALAVLAEEDQLYVDATGVLYAILALAAIAAGLGVYAAASRQRWAGALAVWFAAASALTIASDPAIVLPGRLVLGLALAVTASAAVVLVARLREATVAARLPLIVGAHLAVLLCVSLSRQGETAEMPLFTVCAGIGVVLAIAAVARTIPRGARFVHVGIGYAYALVTFARTLGLSGVEPVATLCLTTSVAALGAIGATYLRRIGPRAWWAILVVTSVPFVVGVVQVVFERSGWTALSTGLIFLLALTLTFTRRAGLGVALRSVAAGLLVPSLAVVAVCLGAQLLVDSGSPVVLPVIAAITAIVLPSTDAIRAAVVRRGIGDAAATAVRLAVEGSTLLTAAIAVALGLLRDAAGLGTTLLVLVLIGLGAVATAVWGGRRYAWWVAGAAFTGALWCAWGSAGIDAVEPYLLPPALAAAIVGAVLTARGHRALPLYASGLVVAVVPVLLLLVADRTSTAWSWRAFGLVAASFVLVALGAVFARFDGLRVLRPPASVVAIVAGAAGALEGVRLGLGMDAAATAVPLVIVCVAISLAGAVPAFLAGRAFANPWMSAPAVAFVGIGTWTAIERDWFTIWAMWTLMLAYLGAVVFAAWRIRPRADGSAVRIGVPVWFLFALAFATAVVAWSPRDLRVEWFSLPLGAALLAAGALHVRRAPHTRLGAAHDPDAAPATPDTWPARWRGSWALLGPGLAATFSASMTATFTDPLTWRAILVIVLALVAILVGASLRLAAPFLVGIVVLPIENVLVFLVQIGRGIESMPWWITLAVVGAVLLIIAVTYERRGREPGVEATRGGIGARLRDLA